MARFDTAEYGRCEMARLGLALRGLVRWGELRQVRDGTDRPDAVWWGVVRQVSPG